jgi:isopenicillin-N N-acyltransferase-like protein
MNEKGVTVTINAAKSDLPTGSAMPISILARQILQYADNIQTAYAIAKNNKTFVAEAIMIGSASDHRTAIIEKSPSKTSLYSTEKNYILCTNHFQSDTFLNDRNNLENIKTSASMYRYERLQDLVEKTSKFNYLSVGSVLRDQKGHDGKNIGIGNEKAINQMICHHSIIFQPEKLRFWVSTQPYQLGEFICYDLKKIFDVAGKQKTDIEINEADLTIPTDSFIYSASWKGFLKYKELKTELEVAVKTHHRLADEATIENSIIVANPEYWETYDWLGQYFREQKDEKRAIKYFKIALTKEVNDKLEEVEINKSISELSAKR